MQENNEIYRFWRQSFDVDNSSPDKIISGHK